MVRGGGAGSLLARGAAADGASRVVLVTEKSASVHVS